MNKSILEMTARESIMDGLRSLEESLERGEPLTQRTVTMVIRPQPYSARQIRTLRRKLNASQGLLAHFLGVSPITLQSWEQGKRKPSPMARRFMDELNRNPA